MEPQEPKDAAGHGEVRWAEAWSRRLARTEDPHLKATLEKNITAALREDPKLAEALEKVTQSMGSQSLAKAGWSCCRGV